MRAIGKIVMVILLTGFFVPALADKLTINVIIHNDLIEPVNFSRTEVLNADPPPPQSGSIKPGGTETFSFAGEGKQIALAAYYSFATQLKGAIANFKALQNVSIPLCDEKYMSFQKNAAAESMLEYITLGRQCDFVKGENATIDVTLTFKYSQPPTARLSIENEQNPQGAAKTLTLFSSSPNVSSAYYTQAPATTLAVGAKTDGVYTSVPTSGQIVAYTDKANLSYGFEDKGAKYLCTISYYIQPISSNSPEPKCIVTATASNENSLERVSCSAKALAGDSNKNQCHAKVIVQTGPGKERQSAVSLTNRTDQLPSGQDGSIKLGEFSPQSGSSNHSYDPATGPAAFPTLAVGESSQYQYLQRDMDSASMTYAYAADDRLRCRFQYANLGTDCVAEAAPGSYIGTVRSLNCVAQATQQTDGSCKTDFSMRFGDYRPRGIAVQVINQVVNVLDQPVVLTRTALEPDESSYNQVPPATIQAKAKVGYSYELTDPQAGSVTYAYVDGDNTSACKITANWVFSPFGQNLGCSVTTETVQTGKPAIELACDASPVEVAGQTCSAQVTIQTGKKRPPLRYQVSIANYSGLAASLTSAVPASGSGDYESQPSTSIPANSQTSFSLNGANMAPTPANPATVIYQYSGVGYGCEFSYSWDPAKLCDYKVQYERTGGAGSTISPAASGLRCSACPSVSRYDPSTRTCYVGFAISLSRNCEVN